MHVDLWVIRSDGSQAWQLTDEPNTKRQGVLLPGGHQYYEPPDAKRLTTLNLQGPAHPENLGAVEIVTTVAIGSSGTFLLGDTQDSLVHQTGLDWTVRFTGP